MSFPKRCGRLRVVISACVLLLLLPMRMLHAQPESVTPPPAPVPAAPPPETQLIVQQDSPLLPAPPCEGCYEGFSYDSTFRMGAHFNGLWDGSPQYLKDSLHIPITRLYGQPDFERLFDSATWGDDERTIWLYNLRRQFWRDIKASGLGVIVEPYALSGIAKGSEMSEAYFGQASGDTLHRITFNSTGTVDVIDRPENSFIWGGFFPRSQPAAPVLMAGGPYWTAMGIAQTGYYLPSQSGYAGAYDIATTVKVDVTDPDFDELHPDSLIAYVRGYRRIPVGQDTCGCNLYQYVDSLPITKAIYTDTTKSDVSVGNGYRDVTFTFQIPEPTITVNAPLKVVPGPGDTVTALAPGTYNKYVRRGGFMGWHAAGNHHGDTGAAAPWGDRYCGRLRQGLIAAGYYDAAKIIDRDVAVDRGDFGYEVYTTGKVDVTFLRGRLAPHTYALLRRGEYNATIRDAVTALLRDSTLDSVMKRQMFRLSVVDENAPEKYRGYMDVASRAQHVLNDSFPDIQPGIWSNPQADDASFRVLSGDLDTTSVRMIHMSANQWYNYGGLTPVAYANPDSMPGSAALTNGLYRAQDDPVTGAARRILYNNAEDHAIYTGQTMADNIERIDHLARMTDASRFMFRHIRRESYPVYSVVQVHGMLNENVNGAGVPTGYAGSWSFVVVTPEEITVQAWLALNCGVDGLWFSDFTYDDAHEFGVLHWLGEGFDPAVNRSNYWTGLNSGDPTKQDNPAWQLPRMWTGFLDRTNAVKRITSDFQEHIIPVYEKLNHNGIRMNVWRDRFFGMPMLDTLYAMRAARFMDGAGGYEAMKESGTGDTLYDRHDSTYILATLFEPGPADTNRNSRYLLVTNLRCWPYDEKNYSSYVRSFHTTSGRGLGAIDVRRPVVVLKNTTGVIADQALLQRIGDTVVDTVSFGDPVMLDWLDPGWGAMYRITPIIKPVSALATAYNNAVHALNPSVDGTARDRLFVYERDSAVYVRAMDSMGHWGPEHLISLPADTVTITVNGKKRNTADNMFPAIDMIRNGGPSCAIVWERHDPQTDLVTVEMAWLPSRPTRSSFPSSIVRRRLTRPRTFAREGMELTPAITGVDSGYVVAWAAPDYTAEVMAVRDNPVHGRLDTSRTLRVKMIQSSGGMPNPTQPDSLVRTPSLAYVRNWGPVVMNGGILSGPDDDTDFITMPALGGGTPNTIKAFHIAHLAYSQGKRSSPETYAIMYNRIGAMFPPLSSSAIPRLWASATEKASIFVPGTNWQYPSIAVDSVRVGVTFTTSFGSDYVYLRFKNPASTGKYSWNTPAYVWGGGKGAGARSYDRSSLTMFPDRSSLQMQSNYEGALTWQWTNAGGDRHNGVKFYRFGRYLADSAPDGRHPTMMLVPGIGDNGVRAMKSGGIFRRGADAEEFERLRQRGDTGVYYPGYFDNTPVAPFAAFEISPPTAKIHAEGRVYKPEVEHLDPTPVNGGFQGGIILSARADIADSIIPPGPPPPPNGSLASLGMPPAFFPRSSGLNEPMTAAGDLGSITRTPSFTVDTTTITIMRTITGDASLVTWLNSQPNDPVTGLPASIYYEVQVVRDSDGVVLWAGDTISARGAVGDTLLEEITVPVQSVAAAGTSVHVRLAAVTSTGLQCSVSGGYRFGEEEGGAPAKRMIRSIAASGAADEAIGVRMIPNPMHGTTGELRITIPAPGSAEISVYDLLGSRVMALPPIEAGRAGEYAIPVDLSPLRDGIYIVDVRSGARRGSTRISVLR